MPTVTFDEQIESITALGEPIRRALYHYVISQGHDVSRDEAAEAVGITRPLAAFHLDKLVAARLLEHGYRRLSGRQGPGAGRPSKIYRRSSLRFDVSLPPRDHRAAVEILLHALKEVAGAGAFNKISATAFEWAKAQTEAWLPNARLESLVAILEAHNFEPIVLGPDLVRIGNSPFVDLGSTQLSNVLSVGTVRGFATGCGLEVELHSSEPLEVRVHRKGRLEGGTPHRIRPKVATTTS